MNWEEIRSRESLTAKESKYICNDLMSTGLEMERLIVENFGPEDYYKVAQRRIGGGRIGGKACGLLLARKLIQARMPQYLPEKALPNPSSRKLLDLTMIGVSP